MTDALLLIGIALFLGFVGGEFVEKIKSPHIVGFIVIGAVLGNILPDVFSTAALTDLDVISFLALAFIGFDVGGEMTLRVLRALGKNIMWIAVLEALGAFIAVGAVVFFLTKNLPTALILGALASSTAPSSTVRVLREYRASGPLTSTLFGIVAVDDAIAVILYSFASAYAKVFIGNEGLSVSKILLVPFAGVIISILLGAFIGVVLHRLIVKVHDKTELLILTLSMILINSGAAITFHLSLILANMALGVTLINLSSHGDKRAFDAVGSVSPPIYVMFFVLAGARLRLGLLPQLGLLGLSYILFRGMGKVGGSYLGARISKTPHSVSRYIGLGLIAQAGVAVGLSLQAFQEFQAFGAPGLELGLLAVNLIAATTFILELIGPPLTKTAIFRAGEADKIPNPPI